MIGSFRNFAKTKFAGILVFLMIIPFVFWGMGSMFSTGNTNNIAKINKKNISTEEFFDHINQTSISEQTIRDNLSENIIEELLSTLISTTLLELEIEDFNILVSEDTLLKIIKSNKDFHNNEGNFERTKYEKFLLENNQSAPGFELRLTKRELQKKLFDYIGGGTVAPKFLVKKLFEEKNKKLEVEYLNLESFYSKKDNITENQLRKFINENQDQLKIEYIDFKYSKINPINLIGINEFNQSFFDKIDQIEIDISNELEFETIVSNLNLTSVNINNFRFSENKNEIEKKIFELKNNNLDIFEMGNDYILYKIEKIEQREPDLNDNETTNEIKELISQKDKFDFNKDLLEKIKTKKFDKNDFLKMGKNNINNIVLNSINDNSKFESNSLKLLYSLPENSFTLITDEDNNIYLAKIKEYQKLLNEDFKVEEYTFEQNSNFKNSILKSYDLFLNKKYNVELNQKTLERVKNYFQ